VLHHLSRVLRLKVGDRLECFDGQGGCYVGVVRQHTRDRLTLTIEQRVEEPPGPLQITLAFAVIRPERIEWIIEKATELGVSRLVPFITSRTRMQRSPHGHAHRLTRWRRIVTEATRQCGRSFVPSIEVPQPFEQLMKEPLEQPTLLLTLAAEHRRGLEQCLRELQGMTSVTIMIGPEGDFSPEEIALATQRGAQLITIGQKPLRAETAAIVALTILQHAVGVL